jgi:hypothetical protein
VCHARPGTVDTHAYLSWFWDAEGTTCGCRVTEMYCTECTVHYSFRNGHTKLPTWSGRICTRSGQSACLVGSETKQKILSNEQCRYLTPAILSPKPVRVQLCAHDLGSAFSLFLPHPIPILSTIAIYHNLSLRAEVTLSKSVTDPTALFGQAPVWTLHPRPRGPKQAKRHLIHGSNCDTSLASLTPPPTKAGPSCQTPPSNPRPASSGPRKAIPGPIRRQTHSYYLCCDQTSPATETDLLVQ